MLSSNLPSIGDLEEHERRPNCIPLWKRIRHAVVAVMVVIGMFAITELTKDRTKPIENLSASKSNVVLPFESNMIPIAQSDAKPQIGKSERSLKTKVKATPKPIAPKVPTSPPTAAPVQLPLDALTGNATFYVIGDVPYDSSQLVYLKDDLSKLSSADFLVHVGDIKSGQDTNCVLSYYTNVAQVLLTSPIPVFVLPGDNEWNDCAKPNDAWKLWASTFMFFENNWHHDLKVTRMPGRNETFAFINKGTLFMGFNIVGGRIYNSTEWNIRLSTQANWAIKMIKYYDTLTDIGRIVIFSHADPTSSHAAFYDPLKSFVINQLKNSIPIMSVNGDGHYWDYSTTFFSPATSMLRVMVTAKATRPPHRCYVHADGSAATLSSAFSCIY